MNTFLTADQRDQVAARVHIILRELFDLRELNSGVLDIIGSPTEFPPETR